MTLFASRIGRLAGTVAEPRSKGNNWPIVLVHGLGAQARIWENFQRYFALQGRRSYALELPGDQDIDIADYALQVAGALVEIGPAIVVGHSLGALIVQQLGATSRQPGYVLMSSVPPWPMLGRPYWPLWGRLLRSPVRQVLLPLALHRPVRLDADLQRDLIHQRLAPSMSCQLIDAFRPAPSRAVVDTVFGRRPVPARSFHSSSLVIGGLADRITPASEQRRIAAYFGSSLKLYDRAHMLMLEPGWEEIAADLQSWIAALEPRRLRPRVGPVMPLAKAA